MTAIDPTTAQSATSAFATALAGATNTATQATNSQTDQDTFLKLLVAQLQYQDPMSPVDSTQFLAQSAQFTMVEKLDNIENALKADQASSEVLEAGSMIGKTVDVATQNGHPAVTTVAHVGGNLSGDAPVGSKVSATTTIYTTSGQAVPIRLEYTKLADGSDGSRHWQVSTYLSTTQLSGPTNVDFDADGERTSPDVTLTTAQLENVPGTTGTWDPNGVRLDMGTSTDANRLRVASGASSLAVYGQNGTDGQSVSGVVTAATFTATGPLLTVNGNQYAMTDVTGVRVSG